MAFFAAPAVLLSFSIDDVVAVAPADVTVAAAVFAVA
jgi:hypothetical protein